MGRFLLDGVITIQHHRLTASESPHRAGFRAWDRVLDVGGLVWFKLAIQSLLVWSESVTSAALREKPFPALPAKRWKTHVILCGYGRIGREIAETTGQRSVPLSLIEMEFSFRKRRRGPGGIVCAAISDAHPR